MQLVKYIVLYICTQGFPGSTAVKNLPANAGDAKNAVSMPEWRRSPGEGNCNPLQYSCLENPMDKGAWGATVRGIAKESDTCQHTHRHLYGSCTRGWIQAASLVEENRTPALRIPHPPPQCIMYFFL